jgi:hypothetical protein
MARMTAENAPSGNTMVTRNPRLRKRARGPKTLQGRGRFERLGGPDFDDHRLDFG